MIDTIGWIGTAIMAFASIDIAHMRLRGWWLMLVGNIIWCVVGYLSGLTSIIGVSILMGGLDIYGLKKWKRQQRIDEVQRLCVKYDAFHFESMLQLTKHIPILELEQTFIDMREDVLNYGSLFKAQLSRRDK